MEFAFQDELGHTVLNALKELGEGINMLGNLERNLSNTDVDDFDVMKLVSHAQSLDVVESEVVLLSNANLSFEIEDIPPPPHSPIDKDIQSSPAFSIENHDDSQAVASVEIESLCSDEWDNDDDLGYVTIPLTEQEFFEMEEDATFRHNLVRGYPNDPSVSPTNEFEECESIPEDELNTSFRKTDEPTQSSYMVSLDLRTISPELSIEIVQQDVPLNLETDNYDEAINDINKISLLSQDTPSLTFPPPTMGSFYSNGNSNRRETEIWGQRKILGVDGEHRYFDLKVIFEPYRTGFEEDKNFNPSPGTIVAGRYEVAEMLGQAAFSTAWQCVDLNAEGAGNEWVCLKVIKNSKDFFDQSLDEIKLLQYINSKGDPHKHNVLKMIDFFYCKEHLFIVSELLRENLYEFGKYIRESGAKEYFTLPRLKKIVKQILEALVYIHSLNLIHCDIKPENIVIRSYSRCEVKLIDFGSSCFITDHLTSYIQSRSYRAPEVILGLDYGPRIDIWSLGGVLAEMHTGYVLFQNDSIATMLARIQGILGPYPSQMLDRGREVGRYFTSSGVIFERSEDVDGNTTAMIIYPKRTTLRHRLHLPCNEQITNDETQFLDFVTWMLQLDPEKRPSAGQALLHPWFDDVDLNDVSYVDA